MKSTKRIALGISLASLPLAAALLIMPAKSSAASWVGSIKVTGKHSDAELTKMAKVPLKTAEKTALAAVKAPAAAKKVAQYEVEAEGGYLVYSIEVKVQGKPGVQEFLVDAGNGKILDRQYESPEAEKTEK